MYFSELSKNICLFMNTDDNKQPVTKRRKYAHRVLPYTTVYDRIRQEGLARAYSVSEYGSHRISTFDQLFTAVQYICRRSENSYVYTYWPYPDADMHRQGICGIDPLVEVNRINTAVEELSLHMKDTLIIVTADHGQINGTNELITDYPDIADCLLVAPAIEPRALSFRLKSGTDRQSFEAAFRRHFGDDFLLMSRDEILASGLFGNTAERLTDWCPPEHPRFREFLGDYIGIAAGTRSIFRTPEETRKFVGIHAGLLEKEMFVPLIIVRT
jgi:predicted AlkP superfamily pyrophosphatase or phosphodiesterase